MTSDAKIGLLLGLAFIFIIAFIINGLPRFRSATNNSELTTNMVSSQNDALGIGGKERKAQEAFNWTEQVKEQALEEVQPPLEGQEDVRFKMQLPQNISTVKDTSIKEVAYAVEPAAPEPMTDEKTVVNEPEPAKPALPKVYVVCDGDNLADIAKKFYGPEEGNRRANIMRIFAANRNLLTSPHEIYVGQKLIIPPLRASEPDKNEAQSVFPSSMFEKVKSIGRKHFLTDDHKTKRSVQYIVREDDNLWRIAAEQLGDGSRYPEISKLNADVLENEDSLTVGMRLRIPAE